MKVLEKTNSKKYKAVIFDFDDTLVESRHLKWEQHKVVAKKFYDIDLVDEDIRAHWGKPFNTLVSLLYKDSDSIENMIEAIISTKDDFLKKPYKESQNVTKNLLENGIEVGIISAANKNHLIDDLSRLGFPYENFFIIQGADEVSVHKPDPRVFLGALDLLKQKGIDYKEILYIGDSVDDLEAAHGAGIGFIAMTTGLYSYQDFETVGAKIILKDVGEILDFVL